MFLDQQVCCQSVVLNLVHCVGVVCLGRNVINIISSCTNVGLTYHSIVVESSARGCCPMLRGVISPTDYL